MLKMMFPLLIFKCIVCLYSYLQISKDFGGNLFFCLSLVLKYTELFKHQAYLYASVLTWQQKIQYGKIEEKLVILEMACLFDAIFLQCFLFLSWKCNLYPLASKTIKVDLQNAAVNNKSAI